MQGPIQQIRKNIFFNAGTASYEKLLMPEASFLKTP
jgi:hypothetical protein